ncbi:MAG: D-isomer specific 2-hydroxyacid dehydrogenase family protein [Lachnospiraceae bacterium]|nr:D-isomer specific 2-hydroxyacid dehydrogenase family protein [Lachnospiraceae bacterium]
MKIAAYSCRPDELALFEKFGKQYGVELVLIPHTPTLKNAHMAKGCQAVSVVTSPISAELLDLWHEDGVRVVSTRTVGYEHVDIQHAARLGIRVSNVSYTPNTVAEYTVMAMLMAIRKMKTIMTRYMGQDFTLNGVRGRELCRMTVGVVGTGRIGEAVIRNLSGFGCRILACDLQRKESAAALAEYVELEQIWSSCDLITFHTPATEVTYHLVNRDTLSKMKDGVVLINMARGSIIDTDALIDALECGKAGAAALDVVENEGKIYYRDFKDKPVRNRQMAVLQAMPNVIMTPHTAFFTDEAVSDMIAYSIQSCLAGIKGEEDPWQVNEIR